MTATARLLRLDRDGWRRIAGGEGVAAAALITMGAYAILAFDRFGPQAFVEPRAAARFLLVGFYGWVWLAAATWAIGRLVLRREAAFTMVLRLSGHAHLPLVVAGITILIVSVFLQVLGPARVVALFAIAFWMPASLVAATRTAFVVRARTAILVTIGPYAVWLLVVGRSLETRLGHLL